MSDIRTSPDVAVEQRLAVPDYELEPRLVVDTAVQLKAFADPVRRNVLDLLLERAATTTELAVAIGRPKGTIDHHLKVLANAGLIHVVRTRQVRAMTEKFWGRTARTFLFEFADVDEQSTVNFIRDALDESAGMRCDTDPDGTTYSTLRHARIAPERVREFIDRLDALAVEFASTTRSGTRMYGMLMAVYPTDQPVLAS